MFACLDAVIMSEWGLGSTGRVAATKDFGVEFDLFLFSEVVPPRFEFSGVLDFPAMREDTITSMEYNINGIREFVIDRHCRIQRTNTQPSG